jgi:hypothetical protein
MTEIRPDAETHIRAGFYGGKFEDAMNELFSSNNIKRTAEKIKDLERQYGPFEVGKFNRYLLPNDIWPVVGGTKTDATTFEKDFTQIPDVLRKRLSEVIRTNLHSDNPLPIFYRTSENVDKSHDIIVKPFVYSETLYLGVLYLCPNHKTPA